MIHYFECNGFYLLLDIASGAVFQIDRLTYDLLPFLSAPLEEKCPAKIIDSLPQYPKKEIEASYKEVFTLYKQHLLFTEDEGQNFAKLELSPVKAMCLNVAHDCNLRCRYCFASTGDFGQGRKLMDKKTGEKAIDFLIANSGKRYHLELDFFGGEPLMNYDVVKHIVNYARGKEKKAGKHFRFTITTNGILLDDEKIEFLNKEMDNIVLSLDGRKEINDKMRPQTNHSGSYENIVPKYQKLIQRRGSKDYYVRGTYTKYNLDFSKDLLHMYRLGFKNLSIEPVVTEPTRSYAIQMTDLPMIFSEYEKLAKNILHIKCPLGKHNLAFRVHPKRFRVTGTVPIKKAGFKNKDILFFHFMLDLKQGPCLIKRLRGCSCGNEYVAVTPEGDIYPCHQFIGKEEWKLGDLSSGIVHQEKRKTFTKTTIFDKPQCSNCWARYYCSGGCNANHLEYSGSLLSPDPLSCEIEKKRLECAIMIQAALQK